jgi:hypothetical protein
MSSFKPTPRNAALILTLALVTSSFAFFKINYNEKATSAQNRVQLMGKLEGVILQKYGLHTKAIGNNVSEISDINTVISEDGINSYHIVYGTMNTPILYSIGEYSNTLPVSIDHNTVSIFPNQDVLVIKDGKSNLQYAFTYKQHENFYGTKVATEVKPLPNY